MNLFVKAISVVLTSLVIQAFSYEKAHDFDLYLNLGIERATLIDRQDASENQNSDAKPTQPKTDSSRYVSIDHIQTITPSSSETQKLKTPAFYEPWYTGPFLIPTPVNMDPKHPALEISTTIFNTYGLYRSDWTIQKQDTIWAINPMLDFQMGITNNIGLEFQIPYVSRFQNGRSASHFQDVILLLGYQVLNDTKGSWIPDFRFMIQETFPTGKYQKLNPKNQLIDATGFGSFQTGPVLSFCKLLYFSQSSLALRGSVSYLFPTTVHVKDYNLYGGGYKTKGKVKPGQTLNPIFSIEYSFHKHWTVAFESDLVFQRSSHFKGKKGITSLGEPATVGLPPTMQISFAPEIEYVFTPSTGILGGFWLTIAGKNSPAFASLFLAFAQVF